MLPILFILSILSIPPVLTPPHPNSPAQAVSESAAGHRRRFWRNNQQNGRWRFIDYGGGGFDPTLADFFEGWADFTLPPNDDGYTFFLNAKAWDAQTQSPFALTVAS